MARSDLHALTYPKERVHQKFNYVGRKTPGKRNVKTPPVFLFSTIWSQVEPEQPNRKNQKASFPRFPPSRQTCK